MELDKQISIVCGSDMVALIPKLCFGPSSSQTMLYHANSGSDYIDPAKSLRNDDRSITDAVSDHFMAGYTERLDFFLKNQSKKGNIEKFKISDEEIKEMNKLMKEVEDA